MAPMDLKSLKIGFVPGTGRMSLALARHFCRAGLSVLLGSRCPHRAESAASELSQSSSGFVVGGFGNELVASQADLIVWSPRGSLEDREALLRSLARQLEGKIIVDVTNVLYMLGEEEWGQTSSTLRNKAALGVEARWTTAFKATFARALEEAQEGDHRTEGTLVAGDDEEAVETTVALVETVPCFTAIRAGGLHNTKIIELLGPPWLIQLDQLNAAGSQLSGWSFST